eukprot:3647038-Lingulodinium_polyedra.AAC.1
MDEKGSSHISRPEARCARNARAQSTRPRKSCARQTAQVCMPARLRGQAQHADVMLLTLAMYISSA